MHCLPFLSLTHRKLRTWHGTALPPGACRAPDSVHSRRASIPPPSPAPRTATCAHGTSHPWPLTPAGLLTPSTPIVLPSERVLRGLLQQYQQYEGDVASLLRGLHAMHLLHHAQQPLASLMQVGPGQGHRHACVLKDTRCTQMCVCVLYNVCMCAL